MPCNWCRYGVNEACPFGRECEYIHLQQWLSGNMKMQSILQRDKSTLQGNLKKAATAAKSYNRTDICKNIISAMKYGGMECGPQEDEWENIMSVIELVCGMLHYDIEGMHPLFKTVTEALIENLSAFIPRGVTKNRNASTTSSRESVEYSDCTISLTGSESEVCDHTTLDSEPIDVEFISMYYT